MVSLVVQQQTSRVEQLQQLVKTLQARRPSPERAAPPGQPPLQLRTAADVAAHEEVRALQAALASAHARNDVLQASSRRCLAFLVCVTFLQRELHEVQGFHSAAQLECEELSRGFR
jgi:hypothetical protein